MQMHTECSRTYIDDISAMFLRCSVLCLRGSYCGAVGLAGTPELSLIQQGASSAVPLRFIERYNTDQVDSNASDLIKLHILTFLPLLPLFRRVCGVFCGCLRAVSTLVHRHGAKANRQQLLGLTALLLPPRSPPAPPPASTQLLASSASVAPITHTNRQHA